jgi:hypothetical protein
VSILPTPEDEAYERGFQDGMKMAGVNLSTVPNEEHEKIFTELFKNYSGSEAKGFRHALRRVLKPLLVAHDTALVAQLRAAAPTLSEAGACPECHRSDRHEEGCPWDRPPSAKLSDSEKASWNEDLNAKKWDG